MLVLTAQFRLGNILYDIMLSVLSFTILRKLVDLIPDRVILDSENHEGVAFATKYS